jgi:hypothetical protein
MDPDLFLGHSHRRHVGLERRADREQSAGPSGGFQNLPGHRRAAAPIMDVAAPRLDGEGDSQRPGEMHRRDSVGPEEFGVDHVAPPGARERQHRHRQRPRGPRPAEPRPDPEARPVDRQSARGAPSRAAAPSPGSADGASAAKAAGPPAPPPRPRPPSRAASASVCRSTKMPKDGRPGSG